MIKYLLINQFDALVSFSFNCGAGALKQIKVDTSFSNRKRLAKNNSINNYSGSYSQNLKLLNLLKQDKLNN